MFPRIDAIKTPADINSSHVDTVWLMYNKFSMKDVILQNVNVNQILAIGLNFD